MKIQCPCGAKYSFDLTPEISRNGVHFVCASCGLDSSAAVNELIRRELGLGGFASPPSAAPVAASVAPPIAPPLPVSRAPSASTGGTARLRITTNKAVEVMPPDAGTSTSTADAWPPCSKHAGQVTVDRCVVCQKPICPKCMELFGYVCSPLCNAKAEAKGIAVPEFAGKKSQVEARHWRKVGLIAGVATTAILLVLGVWFWYAWIGSTPSPSFSVRFEEVAYAGRSVLCGKDQLVFLHGGTLARYDLKSKHEIWSRELIDRNQITNRASRIVKDMQEHRGDSTFARIPTVDQVVRDLEASAESALGLHAHDQNVWVATPEKLVHYNWDTGKTIQEMDLNTGVGHVNAGADELQVYGFDRSGRDVIVHINMANGEPQVETLGGPQKIVVASTKNSGPIDRSAGGEPSAGLPIGMPGKDAGKPLDPEKVAEQAQSLSLPAKIALPAVLSASFNQERALAELDDSPPKRPSTSRKPAAEPVEHFSLVPGEGGYVQFSVRLVESKLVTRTAMKAAPGKSVLNDNLTVAKTADAANEILNEMQRSRGGDTVTEDESRYRVTVRALDAKDVPDWSGEIIGEPSVFALKTVTVISGGKMLVVLDKANKKLWSATLSYNVPGHSIGSDEENALYGQGPCVEHGDTLYVCDQAVLTAFDLKTGNARWRLPSVGIIGVFFDNQGMIYVNSTTASPDKIKYSRQIDVNSKTSDVALKIDPQAGKTLWTVQGGYIVYVSGKYIYTMRSNQAEDTGGEENPYATGLELPSFLELKRLNPENGKVMWVHTQKRCPLDTHFDGNSIRLVFRKEVQVLKFLSL